VRIHLAAGGTCQQLLTCVALVRLTMIASTKKLQRQRGKRWNVKSTNNYSRGGVRADGLVTAKVVGTLAGVVELVAASTVVWVRVGVMDIA
jgi:hypothetical protein